MRQVFKDKLPRYLDGVMEVYEITKTSVNGFLSESVITTNRLIWFESLSIFDKLKIDSEVAGIELTKKLLVPDTEDLNSGDVVKIDGVFHKIYNVNTVLDKRDSFPKKEITLTSFKEKLNEIVEEG